MPAMKCSEPTPRTTVALAYNRNARGQLGSRADAGCVRSERGVAVSSAAFFFFFSFCFFFFFVCFFFFCVFFYFFVFFFFCFFIFFFVFFFSPFVFLFFVFFTFIFFFFFFVVVFFLFFFFFFFICFFNLPMPSPPRPFLEQRNAGSSASNGKNPRRRRARRPTRPPRGALGSVGWDPPGFVHDVGAALSVARRAPAFRALDLEPRRGLAKRDSRRATHPALDGTHSLHRAANPTGRAPFR